MFRTSVKVTAGALAGVAALAACGPAEAGSAATVGHQRITSSTLDSAVTDWQTAYRKNPMPQQNLQLSDPQSPGRTILNWLVTFRLTDRAAEDNGVNVTPGQVDAYRANLNQRLAQQSGGQATLNTITLSYGVPPKYSDDFVRMSYQNGLLLQRVAPQALQSQDAASQALSQLSTKAARELNVKINPRYGSFDLNKGVMGEVAYNLSRAESGTPSS